AHTVDVKVTDKAGNVSTQSYTFLVETSFATIHNLLDSYLKSGDIKNFGIKTALSAHLDTAKLLNDKNLHTQAVAMLESMKQEISTFVKVKNISATAGTVLTQNIDYLLTNGLK
ncbi:MAG: FIMAH domain-containing protein, partial [Tumebacillaceae bacterium]